MPPELAALLVEARAVSPEDAQRAVERQRVAGGALDTAILALGLVPEAELGRFLCRASGLPPGPRTMAECDPRAGRVFPAGIAVRRRLAPFRLDRGELSVVGAHPIEQTMLDEIGFMLSLRLVPHVAPEWRVGELLAAIYRVPMPERLARLAGAMRAAAVELAPPVDAAGALAVEATRPLERRSSSVPIAAIVPPKALPQRWQLGRVDPEEPLGTAAARAAETFEATELLGVPDPAPFPEAPPGWSLREAFAALEAARDRDGVLAAALRYARDFAAAAAVFALTRAGLSGVDAVGWPGARKRCRAVHLERDRAALVRTALAARGPCLGPVAREAGNEQLLKELGRPWPAVALVYPIVLRDRVVCLLYADQGDAPAWQRDIGDLLLLVAGVGGALERVVRSSKAARVMITTAHADAAAGWQVSEPARAADVGSPPAGAPDPYRIAPASEAIAAPERAGVRDDET